jgi:diadenosine tetraphosphate (Ap4A) HIT family hydrolase
MLMMQEYLPMTLQALADLVLATQKVTKLLDKAFDDVGRTGTFFEGFGVDHVYSKLSPMHSTAIWFCGSRSGR